MSDFTEFVADCAKDKSNVPDFIKQLKKKGIKPGDLQKWFKLKGYDLTLKECSKIIESKEGIIDLEHNTVKSY